MTAPLFTLSPRLTKETETPKDAIQNARQMLRFAGIPPLERDAIDARLVDALDLLEPGVRHA